MSHNDCEDLLRRIYTETIIMTAAQIRELIELYAKEYEHIGA